MPICHKLCAMGIVGILAFPVIAGSAPAQDLPEFRTGASSEVQSPFTKARIPDQSQNMDQGLNPPARPPSSSSVDSAQLPLPSFSIGASSGAQLPPLMPPLPGPSGIPDQSQLPDPSQTSNSSQTPSSSQLPVQFRVQSTGLPPTSSARRVTQRVLEIPVGFERHPTRNLSLIQGAAPFTLRNTGDNDLQTQLTLALQMEVWHDDDFNNAPRPLAVNGAVAEYRPSLQLNIGSIPGPRNKIGSDPGFSNERWLESEYYLALQYLPTIYERLDAGTSRTLQRILAEAGRANPVLTTAVRFEYDENLVNTSDSISAEDTYTLLEISPIITYSPSAKTSLRAQGFYRRITLNDSTSNRNEYVIDTGLDCDTSAKASVGIGAQFGRITFDDPAFAAQDYQQGYLAWVWKPTPKVTFQTRTGVELREFANRSKPNRTSPVSTTVLNWQANERTNVRFGVRVQNQPSVSQDGALFQEVRIAVEVRHEFGWNLYVRGELSFDHRNYDSGLTQMDVVFRPAIGYHSEVSRLFDILNIEVYYQSQQRYSNQRDSTFDRNVFGLQSTIYF